MGQQPRMEEIGGIPGGAAVGLGSPGVAGGGGISGRKEGAIRCHQEVRRVEFRRVEVEPQTPEFCEL